MKNEQVYKFGEKLEHGRQAEECPAALRPDTTPTEEGR